MALYGSLESRISFPPLAVGIKAPAPHAGHSAHSSDDPLPPIESIGLLSAAFSALTIQTESQDAQSLLNKQFRELTKTAEQRAAFVSEVIARLGPIASLSLKESLIEFKAIFLSQTAPVKLSEFMIGSLQERMNKKYKIIRDELERCAQSFSENTLFKIEGSRIMEIIPSTSVVFRLRANAAIKSVVTKLVLAGKTCSEQPSDVLSMKRSVIKGRYQGSQIQIEARNIIGIGGMKSVLSVKILYGPVGSMGDVFAYAKPRKDSGKQSFESCVEAMKNELICSEYLKQNKARHVALLTPVYKKKSGDSQLKGIAMKLYEQGDCDSIICSGAPKGIEANKTRLILAIQVAEALADIHRLGLIHGDVKSSNIFLEFTKSGVLQATVGDFGCILKQNSCYKGVVGTPSYIAPEQRIGSSTGWMATYGIDMWSYGLFLFELFSGKKVENIWNSITFDFMSRNPQESYNLVLGYRDTIISSMDPANFLFSLISALLDEDPLNRPRAYGVVTFLRELLKKLNLRTFC